MKDLFLTPELIPERIKELLSCVDEPDYKQLQYLQHDCELFGYTFDFNLHCEVSNLRIKTSLDYIIEKAGVYTISEISLISEAYNKLYDEDKEIINQAFITNGHVYFSTHLHTDLDSLYVYYGTLVIHRCGTHQEMKEYINSIKNL